jgi:hypothetical protein
MQGATYKRPAFVSRFDSGKQVQSRVRLDNISVGASPQGVFCEGDGYVLAHENDSRLRRRASNAWSNLNPADIRKADIQQNNIGLQLFNFLQGFLSLGRFAHHFDIRIRPQNGAKGPPGYLVVIDEYDPYGGHHFLSGGDLTTGHYIRHAMNFYRVITADAQRILHQFSRHAKCESVCNARCDPMPQVGQ